MSIMTTEPLASAARPRNGTVRFRARDVTGTQEFDVSDITRGTPAGAVAQTLAARMELPTNVPWALRSDRTGSWLQDEKPIDEQLGGEEDPALTLTPKAHLGGTVFA